MKVGLLKEILSGVDDSVDAYVEVQIAPEIYLQQKVESIRQAFYMDGSDLIIVGNDGD